MILRRLGVGLVQLAALIVLLFVLIRILPADPAARLVGMNATPEAYAAARANLGLDKPLPEQFAQFLGLGDEAGLLQGSLGTSWVSGAPVGAEIAAFLPVTLELVLFSFLLALAIAIPVAVAAARRPGGAVDRATVGYGLFAGSQPEFVWGLLLVFVLFSWLGIAPGPLGRISPLETPPPAFTGFMTIDSLLAGRPGLFVDALWHLMAPCLTLAFVLSGPILKMVRDNMERALRSDHVFYARAMGVTERQVSAMALRSALAPSLTIVGILFGFMLGGAVLVESVFSLGGLGQYAIRSILAVDYPAIQGVVLTIAAISLVTYLALDVAQASIDPRVAA